MKTDPRFEKFYLRPSKKAVPPLAIILFSSEFFFHILDYHLKTLEFRMP